MAISSDDEIIQRMRIYRDGSDIVYRPRLFSPLSDMAAGLVLVQLDRYEEGMARRRQIASNYIEAVESCRPEALNRSALDSSMFFRFPLRVPGVVDVYQKAFADLGVQVRKGVSTLLHRSMGKADQLFPVAVRLLDATLSVPIYPALSRRQELRCIEAMVQVLSRPH